MASKLPYKCCNFVGSHGETPHSIILFLLPMVTWCCLLVSYCTNICFTFIRGITSGWQFIFQYCWTTIVCPSAHWFTQLLEGLRLSLLAQTRLYHTLAIYITKSGLLPHSLMSADKNIKKNNLNSNWTTIDLTDCKLLYQESQQRPYIPHYIMQKLLHPLRAASTSVIPGELLDIVFTSGITATWVPCSFFSLLHVCCTVHLHTAPTGTQREGHSSIPVVV